MVHHPSYFFTGLFTPNRYFKWLVVSHYLIYQNKCRRGHGGFGYMLKYSISPVQERLKVKKFLLYCRFSLQKLTSLGVGYFHCSHLLIILPFLLVRSPSILYHDLCTFCFLLNFFILFLTTPWPASSVPLKEYPMAPL